MAQTQDQNNKGEAGGGAGEQAHRAVEAVQNEAAGAADRFRDSARDLKEQAREQAGQLTQQAREKGQHYVDEARGRVVDQVAGVSSAIRAAAGQLGDGPVSGIASYADALADRVDRVGDYLQQKSLSEFVQDASSFARRRPEIVLGGMFLAGLVAARFIKAASQPITAGEGEGDHATASQGYDSSVSDYEAGISESGFEGSAAYAAAGSAGAAASMPDVPPTGTMGVEEEITMGQPIGDTQAPRAGKGFDNPDDDADAAADAARGLHRNERDDERPY